MPIVLIYRVEYADAAVRYPKRLGELMPINIMKIWCRNNRSVMSQPLSKNLNDCFVNKTIMIYVHDFVDYFLNIYIYTCSFGTNKLD